MSDWVSVAKAGEIKFGEIRVADVDGVQIVVFNLDGEYYAIEDLCTHDGGKLTGGTIEGAEIVCPRHGARFCIKTGAALTAPAYEAVATFPIKVENGNIFVKDDRWEVKAATVETQIRDRLAALAPEALELIDESALHVGHAEATGGGHYRLKIIAAQFAGQSRVARHRMVYAMLEPLMPHHIHALALVTQAPGESVGSCEEDIMAFMAEDFTATTNVDGNTRQTIAPRLREHLQKIAEQQVPITYRELAKALGLTPPNTIHQVTEALEHLMAEDAAADRPFIAAIAISKARGGLPAPGFFDCARRLGRFAGDEAGPDAWAFHAGEFNAAVSFWAATAATGKSG